VEVVKGVAQAVERLARGVEREGESIMRIRSLVLIAIVLAAGLTDAIQGSSPALAFATVMVALSAWGLASFLHWREGLRPRPDAELADRLARRRDPDAR
jgi:hypothetical protein